ncbi:hypothetical protein D1164_01225 [Mariniphaga sediminis]|uniref:Uncharacterized protein n=1 Tax=Mariniphaga sediminis TaxID=1628158 RepID=A0A399D6X9_9BACT|nr:hypothetical protein D1164_01225 [Mariniphaga sediminis]
MSWFPELGSYQAFSNRLNRLGGAFTGLVETLLSNFQPDDCLFDQSLLDSMPIITCSDKVSREITDKRYCSTKKNVLLLANVAPAGLSAYWKTDSFETLVTSSI